MMPHRHSKSVYHQFHQFDGLAALDACEYNNKFTAHYHETFQVTWNRSGLFKNYINGKVLQSWPASIAVTHPKEVHTTSCDEPKGHSFLTLYLAPTLFEQTNKMPDLKIDHVIHDPQVLNLMSQIHQAISKHNAPAEQLVFQMIKILKLKYAQYESKASLPGIMADYAKAHYLQPFELSKWAQQLGIDKFKLLRSFKAETGMTPNQFVIYLRIQMSLSYLKLGHPVTNVALECGFYDAAHFYKNFKKLIGVTPLTFQQAHT